MLSSLESSCELPAQDSTPLEQPRSLVGYAPCSRYHYWRVTLADVPRGRDLPLTGTALNAAGPSPAACVAASTFRAPSAPRELEQIGRTHSSVTVRARLCFALKFAGLEVEVFYC